VIEQYSAAHPDEKAAIYSPWTVVRSAPLDLNPALSQQVVTNGRVYAIRPVPPPGAASRVPGAGGGGGGGGFRGQATPPGEIGVGGGLGAQLYWFDNVGRLLARWPAHPLNGNPNFVRGDWYGTGKRTFFWFRFKLEPDGAATMFFKGEVYHMLDFEHTGAEQVITLEGGGGGGSGGGQALRVYGNASVVPHPVMRDADYRKTIANHTHY
jgi:hypothetical protein